MHGDFFLVLLCVWGGAGGIKWVSYVDRHHFWVPQPEDRASGAWPIGTRSPFCWGPDVGNVLHSGVKWDAEPLMETSDKPRKTGSRTTAETWYQPFGSKHSVVDDKGTWSQPYCHKSPAQMKTSGLIFRRGYTYSHCKYINVSIL